MPFISFHPCSSTLKPGSHSWHINVSIRTNKAKQRNAVKPATQSDKSTSQEQNKRRNKEKILVLYLQVPKDKSCFVLVSILCLCLCLCLCRQCVPGFMATLYCFKPVRRIQHAVLYILVLIGLIQSNIHVYFVILFLQLRHSAFLCRHSHTLPTDK